MTSGYIPSANIMRTIHKVAPEFKVRFKTEKPGSNKILAINPEEFFEGETIFDDILNGIHIDWTVKQKQKYLYNQTASVLSYDLNVFSHTPNAMMHEKYARNIFTAIKKNWAMCATFAATYDYLCFKYGLESQILSEEEHDYVMITDEKKEDYLTDPTSDAFKIKFGLKAENYAISKEKFKENSHNLKEAEVEDYEFSMIKDKELEELDRITGYLENFGGNYTNNILSKLANNLDGNTIEEQVKNFLDRLEKIKTIGRPTDSDYMYIMRWILSRSNDKELSKKIEIFSFAYEDTIELPRKIILKIKEQDGQKIYYTYDYKTKTYRKITETQLMNLDNGREIL